MTDSKIVILDTNVYRNLAYIIGQFPVKERVRKINLIKICLINKNIRIHNNYWVICELLNHLENEGDRNYLECSFALEILCSISSTKLTGNRIICNNTIESEIYEEYNPSIFSKHRKNEIDVVCLAVEFVKNGRSRAFLNNISKVTTQLRDFKSEKLEELNFKKKELRRQIEKEGLHLNFSFNPCFHEDMLQYIVEPMIGQVFSELIKAKKDELLDKFFFGIVRRSQVINNALMSGKKRNLTKKFSNHFIDMIICDDFSFSGGNILITDDGKSKNEGNIKSMFEYYGQGNRCLTLEAFLMDLLELKNNIERI